jgi:thymidylate synthase (FAD)
MRVFTQEADIDDRCSKAIREVCEASFSVYRRLLQSGVPRELARSVLPVATYSSMFATANLHNWLRFCSERTHEHAQHEIRVYADAIVEMLSGIAPVTIKHWREGQS